MKRKPRQSASAAPLLDPASRAWVLLAAAGCLLPLLLQLPPGLGLVTAAVALLVAGLSWRRRAFPPIG